MGHVQDHPVGEEPFQPAGKVCISREGTDSLAHFAKTGGGNALQSSLRIDAFADDGVGQVSGTWVTGRPPSVQPGLLIYIMVDSVAATIEAIKANGGEIVQPIGGDAPEITARFRDTAGNVLGLYQERG